ncbi:hypothetical protein L484_004973 [Morus notabilis]|uniref:RNase H type-1 domain-containing protein n=1 Tax=Morus notabilis TaxID=981085 RepID=W9SEI6_9ROSA|nr:hypothetical protein L484_004973 [Morus notabilis]
MNRAFLTKCGWEMLAQSPSLWVKVVAEKYLRGRNFLGAEAKPSDSSFWKNPVHTRDLIEKGACKVTGNGRSINFWKDPRVPFLNGFKTVPKYEKALIYYGVSDLLLHSGAWNENRVRDFFSVEEAVAVLSISLSRQGLPNQWIWTPTKNSEFTVKSTYSRLSSMAIWKARNAKVFQDLEANPQKTFFHAEMQYQEYTQTFAPRDSTPEASKRWNALLPGWIKVNVDCSVGQQDSVIAAVARDSSDNIVMTASARVNNPIPLVAEMEAIRFALKVSISNGFTAITIESDSAMAITSFSASATNCPWVIRNIKLDCDFLKQSFEITDFS